MKGSFSLTVTSTNVHTMKGSLSITVTSPNVHTMKGSLSISWQVDLRELLKSVLFDFICVASVTQNGRLAQSVSFGT